MDWDARSFFAGFLVCLAVGGLAALAMGALGMGSGTPLLMPSNSTTVRPLFSPGSGDEIQSMMDSAQHSIDIEMYEMTTSSGLGPVLAAAKARGVRVRLILEPRVNSRGLDELVAGLVASGVEVRWASLSYTLTHSKMMIVDGHRVLVGSINFSKAAQNTNREADAVVDGPVASEYEKVFETDWALASDAHPTNTSTGVGG